MSEMMDRPLTDYREQFASRISTLHGIVEHLDPGVRVSTTIHGDGEIGLHLFTGGVDAAGALALRLGLDANPRESIADDYRQVRWSGEFDGCAVTVVVCIPLDLTVGEPGV